jgi:D-amino-acid dehydrogenase
VRILVLGAGVVGTTSAWYLSQAGHEVTVVERREAPGMETSFANGGQISAGHAEPWAKPSALPQILRWLGREDAPLLFRLRADPAQWAWGLRFLAECWPGRFERHCRELAGLGAYSRICLRELRRDTGIHYDELSKGILHFATSQRDFDALAEHVEALRGLGLRREVKSAEECIALEPALRLSGDPVVGGIYTPDDESGDAHKFTAELARRAAAHGVHFMTERTIVGFQATAEKIEAVALDNGKAQADAYVVALGSYSPRMLAPLGISLPVYPLKGYSITLRLEGAEASAAPTVSLTDEAYKIVISRLGERLRAAGTAELTGYDASVNAVRCGAILRRVRELFPRLGTRAEPENWAGLRPATPNNVPLIGRTRLRNLFLNTGHGTLGWTLSCGSARALADLIGGRKPEVEFPFRG